MTSSSNPELDINVTAIMDCSDHLRTGTPQSLTTDQILLWTTFFADLAMDLERCLYGINNYKTRPSKSYLIDVQCQFEVAKAYAHRLLFQALNLGWDVSNNQKMADIKELVKFLESSCRFFENIFHHFIRDSSS